MIERRPIPGFDGYFADTDGHIWSIRPRFKTKERRLKPSRNSGGYSLVGLYKNGVLSSHSVHRLVLLAFCGNPPTEKPITRHLNGNPKDNSLRNLVYGTQTENKADSRRHGTLIMGERVGISKLTAERVLEIRRLYAASGNTLRSLAKMFAVSHEAIRLVVSRRTWFHLPKEYNV